MPEEENKNSISGLEICEGSGGQLYMGSPGEEPGSFPEGEGDTEGLTGSPRLNRSRNVMLAVLFACTGAVELSALQKAAGLERGEALSEIRKLKDELLKEESGILIKETGETYELYTNPIYFDDLIRVVSSPKKPELTEVMMETLAIIAEKHPVTRVEIEKIRGVKSDFAVNKLVEYGLVEEKGRKNVPGRPVLFGPTAEFLRRFGIDDAHPAPGLGEEEEAAISMEVEEEVAKLTAPEGSGDLAEE